MDQRDDPARQGNGFGPESVRIATAVELLVMGSRDLRGQLEYWRFSVLEYLCTYIDVFPHEHPLVGRQRARFLQDVVGNADGGCCGGFQGRLLVSALPLRGSRDGVARHRASQEGRLHRARTDHRYRRIGVACAAREDETDGADRDASTHLLNIVEGKIVDLVLIPVAVRAGQITIAGQSDSERNHICSYR